MRTSACLVALRWDTLANGHHLTANGISTQQALFSCLSHRPFFPDFAKQLQAFLGLGHFVPVDRLVLPLTHALCGSSEGVQPLDWTSVDNIKPHLILSPVSAASCRRCLIPPPSVAGVGAHEGAWIILQDTVLENPLELNHK
jgi:hypothetical protein